MKKIFLLLILAVSIFACKEDDPIEPLAEGTVTNNASCGERKICFDLESASYTNQVVMYKLDDTTYFAKYEKNGKQLSIDWFSASPETGKYTAGPDRIVGKSRVYWIPVNNEIWMSQSGEVEITKHENKTVSATFSGVLNKMVNGQPSNESVTVSNGVFTNGQYF